MWTLLYIDKNRDVVHVIAKGDDPLELMEEARTLCANNYRNCPLIESQRQISILTNPDCVFEPDRQKVEAFYAVVSV